MSTMKSIERHESEVRGYVRSFPTVFRTAKGATLVDEGGKSYLDFFAGAGALNYGHNPDTLKEALVAYLTGDGVTHSLDMATESKARFLDTLHRVLLAPRGLNMKVQFPGPTGTNSVEAALKLVRKVTGRHRVVGFTNAFHGMTLGSLAVTGNAFKRKGAGVTLTDAAALPYDGYLGEGVDTLDLFEAMLKDSSSGLDKPAAVIVETVQAEGGVNVASPEWLKRLRAITEAHGVLFIADDIQVGCGRTGRFFSFEEVGIKPDVICLSKSLSGYGLPFAVTLFRPELDVWSPGEHNGTFRGFNPAMVTATAALETFWSDDALQKDVDAKAAHVVERLQALVDQHDAAHEVRGRGLIQGLELDAGIANAVSAECFERGLIIETAGAQDQVLKLLPPLTVTREELDKGLDTIEKSLQTVLTKGTDRASASSVIQA